ncbi:MAG TPA: septation ring formation regulator EzrA [Candidatus Atopostipes pullistercoris]|uniref:Septation ring formation regulator EzrA n=1 Tax=Candidatus Atopostipes pullistercoris TaxID=2838467 RepID=A0A9D2G064_9LACT|nr:septation ring formation regulator EzrA [Candidatus Atopostipes pullistercoris]
MSLLQITLIILIVLVVVTAIITYFVRNNYYSQINELDEEKNEVLKRAPYKELEEMAELNITGQSYELRKDIEKKWHDIESVKYPKLENHLFDAEQATDRYRLPESKKSQDAAKEAIQEINADIEDLKEALIGLIEREQANLEKIDQIKKRYHEVRKSLLAYSFSFGPASESFEQKLRKMEADFTNFSEFTVSGDHEEANKIVESLHESIQETEEQMDTIPPLLEKVDNVYGQQLLDLRNGYEQMTENGYLFPEDTIIEDINTLKEDQQAIYDFIRDLKLEKASEAMDVLADDIDRLYEKMEKEVETKPLVHDLAEDTKRGIYYLQDENRRLNHVVNRLSQSYVLIHNEPSILARLESQVKECRTDFDKLNERLTEQSIPYSLVYDALESTFNQLENLNDEYHKVSEYLESYRQEELELKEDMLDMEQSMYEMKRYLENERLPGLPKDYLELFFSTSDRIENLSAELSRSKIQLIEIRKIHKMCQEDVAQLEKMTKEIVWQVELLERTSQRLYRYKDSHKGILETIRYSESLFTEDYDYDTALRLVREKLENVDPGAYEEIVENYEKENVQEF